MNRRVGHQLRLTSVGLIAAALILFIGLPFEYLFFPTWGFYVGGWGFIWIDSWLIIAVLFVLFVTGSLKADTPPVVTSQGFGTIALPDPVAVTSSQFPEDKRFVEQQLQRLGLKPEIPRNTLNAQPQRYVHGTLKETDPDSGEEREVDFWILALGGIDAWGVKFGVGSDGFVYLKGRGEFFKMGTKRGAMMVIPKMLRPIAHNALPPTVQDALRTFKAYKEESPVYETCGSDPGFRNYLRDFADEVRQIIGDLPKEFSSRGRYSREAMLDEIHMLWSRNNTLEQQVQNLENANLRLTQVVEGRSRRLAAAYTDKAGRSAVDLGSDGRPQPEPTEGAPA